VRPDKQGIDAHIVAIAYEARRQQLRGDGDAFRAAGRRTSSTCGKGDKAQVTS